MNLRLYKTPHSEPFDKGRTRLLFEATPFEKYRSGLPRDFYLYVWIRDTETLDSFQAVLDDEFVLNYTTFSKLTCGVIGRHPMNRAVRQGILLEARQKVALAMNDLECDNFPGLLRMIERIVHGECDVDHRLAVEEQNYCRLLLEKQ